jgi:CHAT domain
MPETISIIVYSIGNSEDPYYFVERNGAWQDFGCGLPAKGLTKLRSASDKLLDRVAALINANSPAALSALSNLCGTLYRQLLPEKLRTVLEKSAAASVEPPILRLHIQEKFDWIPWELMADSQNYLGLRFQIARLPLDVTGPSLDEATAKTVRTLHNLLGHDVIDNNPALLQVWDQTFSPPADIVPYCFKPNGSAVRLGPTFIGTGLTGDILHLTCHGAYDKDAEMYYWALDPNDGQGYLSGITPGFFDAKPLRNGRPLVFANACAFSAEVEGVLIGFGRKLFVSGAQNVIGTFSKVSQRTAIPFARSFYTRLLNGKTPIGQALLETKLEFHTPNAGDPSHLFYCLYGPPGTRFEYA